MACRPVFLPIFHGPHLVEERPFDFRWSAGFSIIQKRKNIVALHDEARRHGIDRILEISSKSEDRIGRRLSAFSLMIDIDSTTFPLESVYQGCKVFENDGPFTEVFKLTPREAKKHIRSLKCGKLIGFDLLGQSYPLSPKNAFYDWLYIRSLEQHSHWIKSNVCFDAFTDIEFNPTKQVNCQARAFAEYTSLLRRGKLKDAVGDFNCFAMMLSPI